MSDSVEPNADSPAAVRAVAAGDEPPPWAVRLRYWAVVAAWMALISYLSTDAFSAANTHRYMDPVLRWLFPAWSNAELRLAHTVIRKCAHFTEFFVLGVLVLWAQRAGRRPPWRGRWAVNALLIVVAYASLDELHQAFTTSRTPSFADTSVDVIGGSVGQVLLYLRHRLRMR
jgi:VanZ family protein